jgi:tetratricopeptide (TPR) repeat protein
MANLTIVIDDDVLRRARIRALEQGTSVNAILRGYLETFAAAGARSKQTAMQLDPRDPQPYFHMGRYYESILNQYDRALEYFRKAVAAGPTDGRSAAYEAYCLELLGHVEEARRGYETAIRLLEARADRFSWPVSRLARLALEENDPDRALFQARRAVELEPQLAGNHLLLGKVHLKKGAISEAVKALSEAIRLDPRDPSAYYLLSTAYAALDRKEAARDALEMFRRLKSVYGTQ